MFKHGKIVTLHQINYTLSFGKKIRTFWEHFWGWDEMNNFYFKTYHSTWKHSLFSNLCGAKLEARTLFILYFPVEIFVNKMPFFFSIFCPVECQQKQWNGNKNYKYLRFEIFKIENKIKWVKCNLSLGPGSRIRPHKCLPKITGSSEETWYNNHITDKLNTVWLLFIGHFLPLFLLLGRLLYFSV